MKKANSCTKALRQGCFFDGRKTWEEEAVQAQYQEREAERENYLSAEKENGSRVWNYYRQE